MTRRESNEPYSRKQGIREIKNRHGRGFWAAFILVVLFLLPACCCGALAGETEEQAEYQIFPVKSFMKYPARL